MYYKAKNTRQDKIKEVTLNFDTVFNEVKRQIVEIEKEDNFDNAESDQEWEAALETKMQLTAALKNCVYGVKESKIIVKALIESILRQLLPDLETLLKCKNFERYSTAHEKFEIIMEYLKPMHKEKSLEYIMERFDLNKKRYYIENKTKGSFVVDDADINKVYRELNIELNYEILLKVLTTLIYQKYTGFGVIDTLYEMDLNGINGGASGSILQTVSSTGNTKKLPATRSIWIQYKGNYIHFRFMTFGTMAELQRVTQLVCRWGNPGALVAKRGYIVNTMPDKSRVVSVRPPAAECYAFFIRKFSLPNVSLDFLLNPRVPIRDENGQKVIGEDNEFLTETVYHNTQLPKNCIKYSMLGKVSTLYTGRQSTGKTTMMIGSIEYIDPTLTLRTIEMTFELYLREIYSERNILSFSETMHILMEELQDLTKKTDAAITLIGEIATNAIAARWIQSGQVSSQFVIASHHGVTTSRAAIAIANSVAADTGMPNDTALQQVLDVLKQDVHLEMFSNGLRYIERITELIPLANTYAPLPEIDENNLEKSKVVYIREYVKRKTERKEFYTRDIMRFNTKTMTYEAGEKPWSVDLIKHILQNLDEKDAIDFKNFIMQNWKVA